MTESTLTALHSAIDQDIRNVAWSANCAGEVFAELAPNESVRIGHFQGDAALAAFVVAAHEAVRRVSLGGETSYRQAAVVNLECS